ncbi:flavodoxin family protein [Nocardioides sp. 616]|uniref:flavodoxin family protein n=1 Tax=Nocardioides sp. 616 TaxID=2268090 RepID=UPI000CE2CF86|nr:flavodoxin family protein [Nocardioides sp. 616]
MSTLVVYESMWGNTRAIARAVARGLGPDVPALEVGDAPPTLPAVVDLLVVGGPTHAFSMSRESTRKDAATKGAAPGQEGRGIREWLEAQPPSDQVAVATFDTRVAKVRSLPGSAAKAAARSVKRHHLGRLIAVESFYVEDLEGPLLEHEIERAEQWGATLSA